MQSRQLETYLEERFGMRTEVLSNYRWVKRAESASIWLVGKESNWEPEREWETLGIPAFRKAPPEGYPTNLFMRTFAGEVTRGVCDLESWQDCCRFLGGESVVLNEPPGERGFCFVRFEGRGVGRGVWTGSELLSRVPKAFRTPRRAQNEKGRG